MGRENHPVRLTVVVILDDLVLTGTYTELGIVSGNSVLVWADTHSTITGSKGIRDRFRNTDGSDGCSKQQGANGPVDNVGLP